MIAQLLNIILLSIKLDKNLYKESRFFSDAAIFFAALIILITSLISILPNTFFLDYMATIIGEVEPPRLAGVIIGGFIGWVLISGYLFFFGAIFFPSKSTQKSFIKTMVVVGYAHSPLVLNCLILKPSLFFIFGLTYIWYILTLIVGLNQLYQYKSLIKSTFLVTAPIILLVIYTLFQISTLLMGTTS